MRMFEVKVLSEWAVAPGFIWNVSTLVTQLLSVIFRRRYYNLGETLVNYSEVGWHLFSLTTQDELTLAVSRYDRSSFCPKPLNASQHLNWLTWPVFLFVYYIIHVCIKTQNLTQTDSPDTKKKNRLLTLARLWFGLKRQNREETAYVSQVVYQTVGQTVGKKK